MDISGTKGLHLYNPLVEQPDRQSVHTCQSSARCLEIGATLAPASRGLPRPQPSLLPAAELPMLLLVLAAEAPIAMCGWQ